MANVIADSFLFMLAGECQTTKSIKIIDKVVDLLQVSRQFGGYLHKLTQALSSLEGAFASVRNPIPDGRKRLQACTRSLPWADRKYNCEMARSPGRIAFT